MENQYYVAVIGAGPAGLFGARELATQGARVAIFNRDIKAGGLAEYGIYPEKHTMKEKIYRIDIHNLNRNEAKIVLILELNLLPKYAEELEIIHGFNGGRILQEMVRNDINHRRIKQIETFWNNGITIYRLR